MFGGQVKFSFKRGIRQFIIVITTLGLLLGCKRNPPEGVLTEQQMVKILSEIYLAEEKANQGIHSYDSIKKVFPQFGAVILQRAGVSDSDFRNSMEYYIANPKKLETIYAAVVDSLQLQSQSAPATTPHDVSQ